MYKRRTRPNNFKNPSLTYFEPDMDDAIALGMKERMKTDNEITKELQQATDGLLWMSESDYPFEAV